MSRPILVDSCWYITTMRQGQDPLRALAELAEDRDVAICGVVKCEVGRGIREPKRLARFQEAWEVMLYIDSSFALWERTLALAWNLGRQGIVLPLPDLHIAACAEKIGAVILTHDRHFIQIPGIDATDRIF